MKFRVLWPDVGWEGGHLLRALDVTEIVCVQNFFNLADRNNLPVVNERTVRDVASVPSCTTSS